MTERNKIIIILIIVTVIVGTYLLFKEQVDRFFKKTVINKNTNTPKEEPLLFQDKVKDNQKEFVQEIRNIGYDYDINPNALMFWIDFESAGTFSSSVVNKSTGATGLIQFLPSTAKSLGTTVEELSKMTNVDQLKYVRKYFDVWKSKIKDWLDVYLAIFYPVAIGKPDTYSLPKGVTPQNPQFDYVIKDGVITVGEIRKYFQDRIKIKVPTIYWRYFNI